MYADRRIDSSFRARSNAGMHAPPNSLAEPRIFVTPERGPVDSLLTIELSGFPPRQELTLRATLDDTQDRPWRSHAVFLTDAQGAVSLAATPPLSGSYASADAEGLLWSLAPDGETPKAPFDESTLSPLCLTFSAELTGAVVASATVERHFLASDCRMLALNEDGLVGTLFRPAGEGPFPTVLVIGGSAGGQVFSGQSAALLAGHGYATLALSYFAAEGLPEHLVAIPLEYFARAMRWLRAQPWARADGLAVVGRSRGGELALLLGAVFPEVRRVVAYCPSNVVWGGIQSGKPVDASAWAHHDEPLPYLAPSPTPAEKAALFSKRPIELRPVFELPVDPLRKQAATIPVERIAGSVLVFSGDDDRMWPAGSMCDALIERLAEHHHPHPFAHHRYPRAGHLLRAPCMPTSVVDSPTWALGGTPEGQALANRQAWRALLRALAGEAF